MVDIAIDGPAGSVITHTALIDSKQGLFFRAAGRRAPDGGWPAGRYEGTIRLVRQGRTVDTAAASVTLPD